MGDVVSQVFLEFLELASSRLNDFRCLPAIQLDQPKLHSSGLLEADLGAVQVCFLLANFCQPTQ